MLKRIDKKTGINIGLFLLVFLFTGTAFYLYQKNYFLNYYPDQDSFYHVRIAQLMSQGVLIIKKFPYLYFSSLRDNFVDWHFLYHVLLVPFLKFFGEPIGPKILNIIIVGGIFGVIYLIFKELKLKLAPIYAIALFFLMPAEFFFRMSMIRAPALVLLFLVLSLYWLIKNRPIVLAITIFFFVWAYYVASFLVFIPIIAYLFAQIFNKEKLNYKILLWALGGFLAGMVINPYFPHNIPFLITQLSVTWNYDVNQPYSATEMNAPDAWWWFYSSMLAAILFFGGIIISLLKNIKLSSVNIGIIIFTFFILILQWKAVRNIEYWPALGALTGILLIGKYIEEIFQNIKKNWRRAESIIIVILVGIFIYEGIFHGIWEFWRMEKITNTNTIGIERIREASNFLQEHSEKGDIVFTQWDSFAPLFYFNQKNYYVAGMNPMFLKVYNQKLFDEFIDIYYYNSFNTDLRAIKDDFKSKWVLLHVSETKLKEKLLAKQDLFEQAYENSNYIIFQVK